MFAAWSPSFQRAEKAVGAILGMGKLDKLLTLGLRSIVARARAMATLVSSVATAGLRLPPLTVEDECGDEDENAAAGASSDGGERAAAAGI